MTHSLCASSTDPFSRIQIRTDTCPNLTFSCNSQGTSSSACSSQGRNVPPVICYPHTGFWFWHSHLSTGSFFYETKPCESPLTVRSAFPCVSGPPRGPVSSPFLTPSSAICSLRLLRGHPPPRVTLRSKWKVSYLVSASMLFCQLQTPPHISTNVHVPVSLLHLNDINVVISYDEEHNLHQGPRSYKAWLQSHLSPRGSFSPELQPRGFCQLLVCVRLSPPEGLCPCCSLCLNAFPPLL